MSYNGQTSAPAPIQVVESNVALYTVNSSGTGAAVATFADSFVTRTNSAKADDVVILWANGLGPVDYDETTAAQGGDMTDVPLEVYVGGKQASVLYRGRNACCTSVDTVYIRVPSGVTGCLVPVTLRIGAFVSNTATIPITANGGTCTPAIPGLADEELTRLLSLQELTVGYLSVTRAITPAPGSSTENHRADAGTLSFAKYRGDPLGALQAAGVEISTDGSCLVTTYSGPPQPVPSPLEGLNLDAGSTIPVMGPAGSRSIDRIAYPPSTTPNVYLGAFGSTATGLYLDAGHYTASGPGGADVGPFSLSFDMFEPLTWTNESSITTVDRDKGLTIEWIGGDPNGEAQIVGSSALAISGDTLKAGYFTCFAHIGDRKFTVPDYVLEALPPSGPAPILHTILFDAFTVTTFSATGVDLMKLTTGDSILHPVTFQ